VRELGVRIALGASPARVFRQVLREGVQIWMLGLAAGVLLSVALARTLRSMLFETPATDPRTLAGMALVVLATALVATLRPAWRAARAQPADVLRSEPP
jgi:ABC-type antimicrobial peptide transport system permease subunit